jgi:methanethiol S-methyltransferase
MRRVLAFAYGVIAYLALLAAILYAIGFVTGVFVPKTLDTGLVVSVEEAIVVNLLLTSLFAPQHSVRKACKRYSIITSSGLRSISDS